MEIEIVCAHKNNRGFGANGTDPAIEQSALADLIRNTFTNLSLPAGMEGHMKLFQRLDNPDAFDLVFVSDANFEEYSRDRFYHAPGTSAFGRSDFEDYPATDRPLRPNIKQFAERLVNGALKPV